MNKIDVSQLLAQMRVMAAAAQGKPPQAAAQAGAPDFGALIKNALNQVNESQLRAQGLAQAFELGDPKVSLSDVMVSLQKANVSFQAMTQVRNKLVQAYQEVMNMQV